MDALDLKALLAKQKTKRIVTISLSATVITAFISAAVTIFTGYTTLRENDQSHQREILKYEMEFVEGFIDTVLQEDVQLRLRLAEYYKSVSPTFEQQERWKQYYLTIKAEND